MFLDNTKKCSFLLGSIFISNPNRGVIPAAPCVHIYIEREDRCYTAGDRMEIESTIQISCWLELQAESCGKSSPATFCNTHMEPFICVLLHTNQTRLNKT